MRTPDPDRICGLCDEFDIDQAAPEFAELGMGRCLARDERGVLAVHVAWDNQACVSFRLDRPNLRRKKQIVAMHRREQEVNQQQGENGIKN